MEMQQITYFVRVAQTGNLTKAADEIGISQPALSRQIRLLEQELGVKLFVRLPSGLRLTEAGQVLLPHLHDILERIKAIDHLMQPFVQGIKGTIVLGTLPSMASYLLPQTLPDFLRHYPEIQVNIQVLSTSAEIVERVEAGDIDVGIGEYRQPGLATITLFKEPLVLILPTGHALAESNVVAREELQTLPLVLTDRFCTVRQRLEAAIPFPLNKALETQSLESALRFVSSGFGPAIVPLSIARQGQQTQIHIAALRPSLTRAIYAIWHPGSLIHQHHPLIEALAQKC